MFNNVLTLQKSRRLTCVWVPTGNPRMPLACVWLETTARDNSKAASSSNDESWGIPLCA